MERRRIEKQYEKGELNTSQDKHLLSSLATATCDELDGVRWFDGLNVHLLVQSSNLKTPVSKQEYMTGFHTGF